MDPAAAEGARPSIHDIESRRVRSRERRPDPETAARVFNEAFSIFESVSDDELRPEQQADRDLIREVKEKTLDRGRFNYTKHFSGRNERGGTVRFTQKEYIPVDGLINFLIERHGSGRLSPEEEAKYLELIGTLIDNSVYYTKMPRRGNGEKLQARIQNEAQRISRDPRLDRGNPEANRREAANAILHRLELAPAVRRVTTPPTEPPLPPVSPPPEPPRPPPDETDPPPTTPPPVEEVRRELVIANRTVDIHKRARELAEEQLRDEMRRGSAWNPLNWARKIGLRVAEEYYRQQYIERATRAMLENNNSYLTMDLVRNAAVQANHRIGEERAAGRAKIEQVKLQAETGERIEGQRIVEATGPLKSLITNELLRPMVQELRGGATITDAQVQERLRQFMQRHENHADPTVRTALTDLFGRGANQYGRLAEYFATDIREMARMVADDIAANRYSLEQIEQSVKIQLANTSWAAETGASFNWVDNAVAWAERRRLRGWLVNPATVGAAASLITFAGIRLTGWGARSAQWLVPGAGAVAGATFAAFRRNYDLKVDMAAHRVDRAYNRQIPQQGAERRRALEDYRYNTCSVSELINGGGQELLGGGTRVSLDQLLGGDLSDNPVSNRDAVLRRIAEITTRQDFSAREKADLITFEGREQVEQSRMELLKNVVEAKRALRSAGMSEVDISREVDRLGGGWNRLFTQNREQQNNAFLWYRLRNAGGAAAFAGIAGLAGGLLTQEGIALGSRVMVNSGVVSEAQTFGIGHTTLEDNVINPVNRAMGFAEWGPNLGHLGTFKELYQNGGTVNLSDSLRMVVDPQTHEAFAVDPRSGNPIPGSPKMYVQNDGHIVYRGARLPKELAEATQDWRSQETVKESIRENIRVFAGEGQPHSITENNIRLDISSDQITATNLDNNVSVQGKVDLTNPDSRMLLEVQGRGAKPNLESLHSALSQNDFQVENITETPLKLPSVLEQVQEAIKDGKVIIFNENGVDFKLDGSQGTWSLVHGPSGITASGVINKATGEFSFDAQKNPGIDVIKVKQYLEAAGFKTRLEERGGGTVIDAVLNQTPDQLKAQRIIETGKIEGEKRWNFHVLRPDYVARTGDHTHNELTMHLGGQRGSNLPLGTLGSTGDLDGVNIQANLRGMPPKNDPELVRLFNRAGGLKHEDLIYIVDLNDGRQISVIPNQQGFAKLPKELYDPNTGYPKGVKVISKTIVEKPDGSVMKASELLNNGQVPKGSIVHSIAAEKYTSETPPAPKVKMLHALAPNDPKWDYKYQFGAIPPGARELIPHQTPETPPFIPIPFAPRHPLESLETVETPPPSGYGFGYRERPLSSDQRQAFEGRASPRIRGNRKAQLNLKEEADWYMEQQNGQYKQELETLNRQIGEDMDENCKICVVMPVAAHQEGKNIYNTLLNYVNQRNRQTGQLLDRKEYEVLIFLNRPEDKPADETEAEIKRFQQEHPDVKVRVAQKIFKPEQVRYGRIVKYLNDLAILRSKNRPNADKSDVILVTNDADSTSMARHYLYDIATELNKPENKNIDGILGKLEWSQEAYDKYPVLHAATRFAQFIDIVARHSENPSLGSPGGNFALRASTYAAVGGYFGNSGAGADQDLSRLIRYARHGRLDNIPKSEHPIKYANTVWLESNPRRGIDYYKSGKPIIDQWADFNERMRNDDPARANNWQAITADEESLDSFNVDRLAFEMNAILKSYGMKPKDPAVQKALNWMGVKARVERGKLKLTDTAKLLANLRAYKDQKRSQIKKRDAKVTDNLASTAPTSETASPSVNMEQYKNRCQRLITETGVSLNLERYLNNNDEGLRGLQNVLQILRQESGMLINDNRVSMISTAAHQADPQRKIEILYSLLEGVRYFRGNQEAKERVVKWQKELQGEGIALIYGFNHDHPLTDPAITQRAIRRRVPGGQDKLRQIMINLRAQPAEMMREIENFRLDADLQSPNP